jgi:hypothetical protein
MPANIPQNPRHQWTPSDYQAAADWYYEQAGAGGLTPALAEHYSRQYRKCWKIAAEGRQALQEGRGWLSPSPVPLASPGAPEEATAAVMDLTVTKARLLLDAAVQQEVRRLDLKGRETIAAGGILPPERLAYHDQRRQESEDRIAAAEDLLARTQAPSED